MDKKILVEYMKGNYNNVEIEEMSLFIDGLLPAEEKEDDISNHNRFKSQSTILEASKNTDSVAHNDALYSLNRTKELFFQFEKAKPLRIFDNCSKCDKEDKLVDGLCCDCWIKFGKEVTF